MGGERIIDDPLSVITLLPLFAGLLLLLLTQVLPSSQSERLASVSRNVSMGIAMAVAVITTLLF